MSEESPDLATLGRMELRPDSERSGQSISERSVKISSLSLCCNMVLSITGTAVLGVGSQMKTFGWILTPLALLIGVALTSEMVWIVAITSSKMEDETGVEIVAYQDFAEAALGKAGWWASAVSSVLSLIGFIIGGIILESQNLQIVAPIDWDWPLGGNEADYGRKWWALLLTSTTLLYCFVDIGRLLEGSGFIGVFLTIFVMTFVYIGTFGQFGNAIDFNPLCKDGLKFPYQSVSVNPGEHTGFQMFLSLFSVSSYVVFIFAIVVTLPTLRSTMRHKDKVTPMSVIAFVITAVLFIIVMLAYYWVFGNLGPDNIIEGMRINRDEMHPGWWATTDPWSVGTPSWVAKVLGWGVTFHLLCSDAIYVPVTVVAIEKLLPPEWVARKRVWISLRLGIAFIRWFLGSIVTDFVKMSNLTSAAFLTLNNMMLPILAFYYAGPTERVGPSRRAMHVCIMVFSVISMVFGTVDAIQGLVQAAGAQKAGVFPRADITSACHNAYCTLNPSDHLCIHPQAFFNNSTWIM